MAEINWPGKRPEHDQTPGYIHIEADGWSFTGTQEEAEALLGAGYISQVEFNRMNACAYTLLGDENWRQKHESKRSTVEYDTLQELVERSDDEFDRFWKENEDPFAEKAETDGT